MQFGWTLSYIGSGLVKFMPPTEAHTKSEMFDTDLCIKHLSLLSCFSGVL